MRTHKHGIELKKKFGQYFLRDNYFIGTMLRRVRLNENSSVLEIGGGSGVLTKVILSKKIARLWVFEIDQEWATHLRTITDQRLTVYEQDFLQANLPELLTPHRPWTLLANLPYQVTFPILYQIQRWRELFNEGVIMIQEEVAQKIISTKGRPTGFISHFFQWYFELELLDKVPPTAFYPQPKVFSRLLYFKPKSITPQIPDEEKFWRFVKVCFKQPRRTLRNNLTQAQINFSTIDPEVLNLRAQQLNMTQLLELWRTVNI